IALRNQDFRDLAGNGRGNDSLAARNTSSLPRHDKRSLRSGSAPGDIGFIHRSSYRGNGRKTKRDCQTPLGKNRVSHGKPLLIKDAFKPEETDAITACAESIARRVSGLHFIAV